MATKSPLQEFQDNWTKRAGWAAAQGIPTSSVEPVMQLDAQRLKNGDYIYSDAEAYRAIQASATMTDPTQSKPISPSLNPLNVVGNFFSDMRNFYSGIGNLFVHPMGNLIDPIIHGVEGLPKTLETSIADIQSGNWTGTFESLSKNTLLDFLPGVSDLGTLASQGIDGLIEHPFYSVIDVAPWGRILGRASEVTGLTKLEGGVGDASRALASKGGVYALGGHLAGKIRLPGETFDAATGLAKRTVGGEFGKLLEKGGFDKISKDLFGERGRLTEELQNFASQQSKVLDDLMRTTIGNSDIDASALYDAITTGDRSKAPESVRANDPIYQATQGYLKSSTDLLTQLKAQDVDVTAWNDYSHSYEVYSPSEVKQLLALREDAATKNAAVDQHDESIANLRANATLASKVGQLYTLPLPREVPTDEALQPSVVGLGKNPIGKVKPPVAAEMPGYQHIADNLQQYVQLLQQYRNNPDAISRLAFKGVKNANATHLRLVNDIDTQLRNVIDVIRKGAKPREIKAALNKLRTKLNSKFISDMRQDQHGLEMTGPMPELREMVNNLWAQGIDQRAKEISNYGSLSSTQTAINKQIQSLERKRAGLQAQRDHANAAVHLWQIEHTPERWTPLQRRILFTRQIARMYLHKERYPMLADQVLDPKLVKALRDAMPEDEEGKAASDLTVNDVHAALQASSLLTSTKANVTGQNLVDLAKEQMTNPTGDPQLTTAIKQNQDIFDKEFEETAHTWQVLHIMGYDPVWLPTRTLKDVEFAARPFLDIKDRVSKLENMFNRSPRDENDRVEDANVALHTAAVELMAHQKLVAFHEGMIAKLARKQDVIDAEWATVAPHEFKKARGTGLDPRTIKKQWVDKYYAKYNPHDYSIQKVDYDSWYHPEEGDVYLPKFVKTGLDKMSANEIGRKGIEKAVVKGNSMFKSTLLTFSPRYAFHMSVGTAFMTMIKTDPLYLRKLGDARQMIKNGTVDSRVPMHTLYDDTAVPIHEYLAGRTMGRLLGESWLNRQLDRHPGVEETAAKGAAILNGFHHHVTMMNNMQRVAVLLEQVERGMKKGKDEEAAMQEALQLTTTIFGDTRRMAPIERTISKTMMPFYSWTRTVLGFALSLPIDNPWRVMILGNLSEQEQNDWNSSLPDNMKYLMFLGNPSPTGNVTAIDIRGIDPMRDVGTYFTLAGVMSVFSPYLQAIPDLMGINPETATPELYPGITYNDFYGTEQASSAGFQGVANAVEGIVPQAAALDFAFGISAQMKYSKANDSKGFAYTLADYLNTPWLPQHINLRQEVARTSVDQYSVLEQQVETALQDNNFSSLMGYNAVPYRGWDMNPRKLAALSSTLEKEYGVPANQTLAQYIPYSRQAQGIDENNPAIDQPAFPAVGASG